MITRKDATVLASNAKSDSLNRCPEYIHTIEKAIRIACDKGERKLIVYLPCFIFIKKRREQEEAAYFYNTLGYTVYKSASDEITIEW